MNLKRNLAIGLTLFMALSHLACGGGGGGGNGGTPVTRTGVFKDSNVAGLGYETSSGHIAETDADGRYTYNSGDTVTFYVGGVSLGTTTARGVVTPVDLVAGGSSSDPEVLNIVRFLMMLDNDGDANNGILISAEVRTAADTWGTLDFGAPDFDTLLASLAGECRTADGGGHPLTDAGTAQSHLEASMRCAYSGAFKGTFSGSDAGRFGAVIDAQSGIIKGAAYSTYYQDMIEGTGTEMISYDQNIAFVTGFVNSGSRFDGLLTSPDALSGTWADQYSSDHGRFSGSRMGGAFGASHRYTGVATDAFGTAAVITMDVDDAGNITGLAYEIENNRDVTISGTLTGNAISAATSDGVQITGTVIPADNTFSGTWYDPIHDVSGSWTGSRCQLN